MISESKTIKNSSIVKISRKKGEKFGIRFLYPALIFIYLQTGVLKTPGLWRGRILMQFVQTFIGIMSRNSSSRASIREACANPLAQGLGSGKHKVAPAPPQIPDEVRASTPTVNNNNNKQPKNGINWPSGSIPRRVKKLSWDDEACQHRKVSVVG